MAHYIKSIKSLILIIITLSLIIYGCTPHSQKPSVIPQKVELSKTHTAKPTNTAIPSKTHTTLASLTTTPQKTSVPTDVISPTRTTIPTDEPSPTWTALPTLSPDSAKEFVTDLLLDNAGCNLPCWWGITPGKTTWDEARQFLSTFIRKIRDMSRVPVVIDGKQKPVFAANIRFNLPDSSSEGAVNIYLSEGFIYKIVIYNIETVNHYQLSQILTEYGEPDEIWIQGWPYNEEHVSRYALLIIYHEGILARYEGVATTPGNSMRLCPQQSGPELVLWNPRLEGSDFVQILIESQNERWGAPKFEPIQVVTDMDVLDFYKLMKDPNACFETPLSLWNDQDFGVTVTPTP